MNRYSMKELNVEMKKLLRTRNLSLKRVSLDIIGNEFGDSISLTLMAVFREANSGSMYYAAM